MNHNTDRQKSALWAHERINSRNWCILDTETTGLNGDAEICQIAVVNWDKEILLDTLVKPTCSISPEATRIHGITSEAVQNTPTFDLVFIRLLKAVGDRQIVIYNSDFDLRLIVQSLQVHGIRLYLMDREWKTIPGFNQFAPIWINGSPVHCAMHFYSQWMGDWNDYYQSYRWQKLPGGDHSAAGDCMAVHRVIEQMAEDYNPVIATRESDD